MAYMIWVLPKFTRLTWCHNTIIAETWIRDPIMVFIWIWHWYSCTVKLMGSVKFCNLSYPTFYFESKSANLREVRIWKRWRSKGRNYGFVLIQNNSGFIVMYTNERRISDSFYFQSFSGIIPFWKFVVNRHTIVHIPKNNFSLATLSVTILVTTS